MARLSGLELPVRRPTLRERLNELADATLFNPLLFGSLRRRGIYTWGNAFRGAGFLLLASGGVVRFVCLRIDLSLADRGAPAIRELLRSEREWWNGGEFPLASGYEVLAQHGQLLGVVVLLAPLLLLLAGDAVRLCGRILGRRPPPLLPDDLRITPLSVRQALAAREDGPYLACLLALIPGLAILNLPARGSYGGPLDVWDPIPALNPWPFSWSFELVFAFHVLAAWVVIFALHRLMQVLRRAGMLGATDSRYFSRFVVWLLASAFFGFSGAQEIFDGSDWWTERLKTSLFFAHLDLLAACVCLLFACHAGADCIREAEERRE